MNTNDSVTTSGATVRSSELVRLPFRVLLFDAVKNKQVPFGPVWVEVAEQEGVGSAAHWDWLHKIEVEAKRTLIADMECSVCWDAMTTPNDQAEARRRGGKKRLARRRRGA